MTVIPFRRTEPEALPMHRALAAWHEADPTAHPLGGELQEAFIRGHRLETDPRVEAFLAGQLARLLDGPDDPWTEARRRAFPEAGAPMEMDRG